MKPEQTLLEQLLKEIEDLREAKAILESVWVDIGPFHTNPVSDKTQDDINKYFGFDDSE